MKKSLAFTLAEVLITLAIIGVVAAMAIPSVIANTNQSQFKTGLQKAVSVLNSAIKMNEALEGETPYDNEDLFEYLQQHMSVMASTTSLSWQPKYGNDDFSSNKAFYTTDGMRFEVPQKQISKKLHEKIKEVNGVDVSEVAKNGDGDEIKFNNITTTSGGETSSTGQVTGYCGSLGFKPNSDTTKAPCLILVDVNGDKKPTPKNSAATATGEGEKYVYPNVNDRLIRDIFPIIITDDKAVPYGVVAQKAMYQASKKGHADAKDVSKNESKKP